MEKCNPRLKEQRNKILIMGDTSFVSDVASLSPYPCCLLGGFDELEGHNLEEHKLLFVYSPTLFDTEMLSSLSRELPVVGICDDRGVCFDEMLSCGAHEILRTSQLSESMLSSVLNTAEIRFHAMEKSFEREKMFLTLCDALPHQMAYRIVVQPDMPARFVYVSEGVTTISGLSREDVLDDASKLYAQIVDEDKEKLRAVEEKAVKNLEKFEIEVRKIGTDNALRWVHIRSIPTKLPDGTVIWDGIESDITHYKESQEKIRNLLVEKNKLLLKQKKTLTELEETNRLKDEFLANLSHELRTPINSVLGWVRLMKRGRLKDAEKDNAIEIVERNALAQEQLIKDLLDMNKIVSGKMQLELEKLDLTQILYAAVDSILPSAESKDISVKVSADVSNDVVVLADAVHTKQVFWNLLSNAVKFTPEGGLLNVSVEQKVSGYVDCTFIDNGIGINEDTLPCIFDRFRQGDSSMSKSNAGLGLGLSIARKIVELHNGEIWAESLGKNQGATFTVRLPLHADSKVGDDPKAEDDTQNEQRLADTDFDLTGVHALIVDDEADALELARFVLSSNGCGVTVARNADMALRLVEKRERPFDVVVSDIGMPGKSGLEFLRELRSNFSSYRDVQSIALTAFVGPSNRKQIFDAGFEVHMCKPYDPEELAKCVMQCAQGEVLSDEFHS